MNPPTHNSTSAPVARTFKFISLKFLVSIVLEILIFGAFLITVGQSERRMVLPWATTVDRNVFISQDKPADKSQKSPGSEITICKFEIPDLIKQANASFYLSYSFEVKEDGQPDRITKLWDDYVGLEKVAQCISQWKFHGVVKGSRMVMFQRWTHGLGWNDLSIVGGDFKQVIKIKEDSPEIDPESSDETVGSDELSRTEKPIFDSPWVPIGIQHRPGKNEFFLSNRSSQTVVRYKLGCLQVWDNVKLVKEFPSVRTHLESKAVELGSFATEAQSCWQQRTQLVVAKLRFQNGATWTLPIKQIPRQPQRITQALIKNPSKH